MRLSERDRTILKFIEGRGIVPLPTVAQRVGSVRNGSVTSGFRQTIDRLVRNNRIRIVTGRRQYRLTIRY